MNLTKKNIQKISGTRKRYKPGQLVTINNRVFRIVKKYWCMNDCFVCFERNYEKYDFCMALPIGLMIKPISKHKG
jgi:hypothetical protein